MYAFKITASREAAEEIASAAFIKIWQKHQRFTEEASIKAYLYRIVRNDALKYLGNQKQQQNLGKEVVYLYGAGHEADHFASLVTAETSRELLEAINALPAECSRVFHLMYVEGKSVKEIAGLLNLSPSTIKTQKARGLAALRKKIAFLWSLLAWCITSHLPGRIYTGFSSSCYYNSVVLIIWIPPTL